MKSRIFLFYLFILFPLQMHAQVGDHRSDFAIGINGGYALTNIGFVPSVSQGFHGGMTGGLSLRYVCEKYFNTICSVQAEVNYTRGAQFFFQVGPQFGYYLSETTKSNFEWSERNMTDRVNPVCAQDTMAVEHKFDYGIAAGIGVEYSVPRIGHFQLEARYYYGLGNIYGDTKRDYFAKSNLGSIVFKLAWLFDLKRTKK